MTESRPADAPGRGRRRTGVLGWLVFGAGLGIALAVLVSAILTQTTWGHERVLGFTLRAVGGRLDGTLTVARLDGNLLTGARLYGVALKGPEGEPFVLADSAFVEYNLPTLIGGDVVLERVTLYNPLVHIWRAPGDDFWNYQRIFGDTLAPDTTKAGRAIVINHAGLRGGTVVVELPWEPDEDLPRAQQDSALAVALSDTGHVMARRVRGGALRTMRFAVDTAALAEVVIAPDKLGGTYVGVPELRADAYVWREPARIRELSGALTLRHDTVAFRADTVRLPESRAALSGAVVLGDTLRYLVRIAGRQVAFRDLRWLYPHFPESGGGSLDLDIETRPDGTLFLARNLDVHAPGTRVRGDFGMILGDTIRFVETALDADPLRVDTIEAMLPEKLPVRGLRIGAVQIRAPVR
jgi:hypothetical protein